jgi:hypothetical protein
MPYYSDTTDPETMASLLKPMTQGEGWKVVLALTSRLMAQHDKTSASPTVELHTRLDRIGRREGLKELVDAVYRTIGEPSPVVRYPELIPQAPPARIGEEEQPGETKGQPSPWPKRRGGSVA